MNSQLRLTLLSVTALFLGIGLVPLSTHAQTNTARQQRLKQYVATIQKIPASKQKLLSGSTLNFFHFAEAQTNPPKAGPGDGGLIGASAIHGKSAMEGAAHAENMHARRMSAMTPATLVGGVSPVNDSSLDFDLSVMAGFTQSETSTAWCGNTVVVGYNDSGAYLRTTGINPYVGASFNGVASSLNMGRTYRGLDYLNPGADPANFLEGDPVVACTSPTQFYYSSLLSTATPPDQYGNRNPLSAISVSSTPNGGLFWYAPVTAIAKDGYTHTLDKDWMAVDPHNPGRIFVSYTDFDGSGTGKTCPNDFRYAIEVVASMDGGSTWSSPTVVDEECGASLNSVQGSQVEVDSQSKVYVAYEFFAANGTRSIKLATSGNEATTFSRPAVVTSVTQTGDGNDLQGYFRSNEFPSMAIDPRTNELYISWADARNNTVPDLYSNTYGYGDIFVTHSTDHGKSWSAAKAISPMSRQYQGLGRDQFMPGIAVDHLGQIAICYYDRRNDAQNMGVDRYCSVSRDGGGSWWDERKTTATFTPVHNADEFIAPTYMGDYDAMSTDKTGQNPGFVGAFQIIDYGNPNVYAAKF